MNSSCVILEKNPINKEKCKHNDYIDKFEKNISGKNENIIQISYVCFKCKVKITSKWKKIGRFYLKNEL